jgi:hypothetical protein
LILVLINWCGKGYAWQILLQDTMEPIKFLLFDCVFHKTKSNKNALN